MAIGNFSYDRNLSDAPYKSAFWAIFLSHIREPHFWFTHRFMHPWRTKMIPDIGRFMYVHVHSTHHKSYNTTSFSGTSMHPVEATLYYTSCFLAIPFGCHPTIFLAILIDDAVGAWFGHGGFVFPGTGDYFHHIHHMTFDCNYGNPQCPIDWLVGSFAPSEEEAKYIWKKEDRSKVGLQGNVTRVHASRKDAGAKTPLKEKA